MNINELEFCPSLQYTSDKLTLASFPLSYNVRCIFTTCQLYVNYYAPMCGGTDLLHPSLSCMSLHLYYMSYVLLHFCCTITTCLTPLKHVYYTIVKSSRKKSSFIIFYWYEQMLKSLCNQPLYCSGRHTNVSGAFFANNSVIIMSAIMKLDQNLECQAHQLIVRHLA